MTAAMCSGCGGAVCVVVTMRSPRGPYQLCALCLGPDAAPPAPTSDVEVSDRQRRDAAVADVLAWFEEHADRIDGWPARSARAPRQSDVHDDQRGQA